MKQIALGIVALGVVLGLVGCQPDQPKAEDAGKTSGTPPTAAMALVPGEWWVKLNKNTVTKNGTAQSTDPFKVIENDVITVTRPAGNDKMCTIVQMSDDNDRIVMDDQTELKMLKGVESGKDYYYAEIGTGKYYFLSYRVAERFGPASLALERAYRVRKSKIAVYANGTIYSLNVTPNGSVEVRVHQGEVTIRNSDFTAADAYKVVGQYERATFGQATNPKNVTVIVDN